MELRINISDPREIAQGLMILQSLALAHQSAQNALLSPKAAAAPYAAGLNAGSIGNKGAVGEVGPAGGAPVVEDAEIEASHASVAAAQRAQEIAKVEAAGEVGTEADFETVMASQDPEPDPEPEAEAEAEIDPEPETVATADDPPPRRKPGRPSKAEKAAREAAKAAPAPKPATARQAAQQPVGAALKGISARDLAAALDEAPAAPAATPEPAPPVRTLTTGSPELDADIATLFKVDASPAPAAPEPEPVAVIEPEPAPEPEPEPEAEPEPAVSFSDAELFGVEPAAVPEPAPAPSDGFDAMTRDQLDQLWRAEGTKRTIHWLRACIDTHNVRGVGSMTKELLISILRNPEIYMPPKVA